MRCLGPRLAAGPPHSSACFCPHPRDRRSYIGARAVISSAATARSAARCRLRKGGEGGAREWPAWVSLTTWAGPCPTAAPQPHDGSRVERCRAARAECVPQPATFRARPPGSQPHGSDKRAVALARRHALLGHSFSRLLRRTWRRPSRHSSHLAGFGLGFGVGFGVRVGSVFGARARAICLLPFG